MRREFCAKQTPAELFGSPTARRHPKNEKPAAGGGGFCNLIIVLRRFPSLAGLAVTYSSKP
jgi:hypothetical protein